METTLSTYDALHTTPRQRFVRTFKCAMKAAELEGRSLQHRLSEFLLNYQASEHLTTSSTLRELFLN